MLVKMDCLIIQEMDLIREWLGLVSGYAVNVTTGKRLNLMFTEKSSLGSEHNAVDTL